MQRFLGGHVLRLRKSKTIIALVFNICDFSFDFLLELHVCVVLLNFLAHSWIQSSALVGV